MLCVIARPNPDLSEVSSAVRISSPFVASELLMQIAKNVREGNISGGHENEAEPLFAIEMIQPPIRGDIGALRGTPHAAVRIKAHRYCRGSTCDE